MNRDTAIDLLDRLHKAQNEFYAGRSGAALEELLAPNITWIVPGDNRIAGTYCGLEEVFGYFRRRRDLAAHTFQMKRRDVFRRRRGSIRRVHRRVRHDPRCRPSLVHRGLVRGHRPADRSLLAASA